MLAIRLRKLARLDQGAGIAEPGSFLILLDGRWGTGKSSILNFLRAELEHSDDRWVIVASTAGQRAQAGPAWGALLPSLRNRLSDDLSRLARWRLRVAEARHRARVTGAPYAFAVVILVA